MPKSEMTKSDSSRIQSSQAKGGGDMSSGGFAARAQSAGDRWSSSQTSGGSGFSSGTSGSNQSSTGSGASSGAKK
ncbi:hypothetical protein GE21DRAFT_5193 [Neurospora crassa]|uniref:SMP domain-containing protein n=2 Tax=Neurospora TaxID=5140 RepID=Q7S273_NEUCR|nr:hypothetical protein NCU09650 [Neurospora crassa OR74A]EAA29480.1 hypothetical protein NCU09650 [Neurospora crassa OR74A]KAK3484783.1 hypothetical protein B0T23DRAFT_457482 [Neurospora hispaniola]KHE85188.1 hypothetical protein GE21DRAFT_5193 [Neurospora crassa]|eukprot:XP_958716.1 hypothetical protein NCU09650 [Neurospora crassa OR74A]